MKKFNHGKCRFCKKELTGRDYYQVCRKCWKPYRAGLEYPLERMAYVISETENYLRLEDGK